MASEEDRAINAIKDGLDSLGRRVQDLEKQVAASQARADERHEREIRIERMLDELVKDSHERKGREAAMKSENEHRHDDRWQVWFRQLFPLGLVLSALAGLVGWIINGGTK